MRALALCAAVCSTLLLQGPPAKPGPTLAPAEPDYGLELGPKKYRGTMQIEILTVDTPLGQQRMNQTLWSMPLDSHLRDYTEPFKGVFFKDYPSVKEMLSQQKLVPDLSRVKQEMAQIMADKSKRGGGEVACALGHYALWQKAAESKGWTVILEDDAVLQEGWNAKMLQHVLDTSSHHIVWLEPRSCQHLTDPGRGRGTSRSGYGGWGTTAYAVTPRGAARLVKEYDFAGPVDLWMQSNTNAACEIAKDHNTQIPLLPFREGKAQSEIRNPLPRRRKKFWDDDE